MSFVLVNRLYTAAMRSGMLALLEAGRRIGLRRLSADSEVLALTFYVIRDLEYPRLPVLVGMNNFDNVLVDLREGMDDRP